MTEPVRSASLELTQIELVAVLCGIELMAGYDAVDPAPPEMKKAMASVVVKIAAAAEQVVSPNPRLDQLLADMRERGLRS